MKQTIRTLSRASRAVGQRTSRSVPRPAASVSNPSPSTPKSTQPLPPSNIGHPPQSSPLNLPTRTTEHGARTPPETEPQIGVNTQFSQMLASTASSDLIAPVNIPSDPFSILPPSHPARSILGNSSIVVQRQLELLNVLVGFEQANRYIIMDGQGQKLGYIAERDDKMGAVVTRQLVRTHRSFTTHVFDLQEREVLRFHRPFAFVNSRIRIYDPVPKGGYEEVEMIEGERTGGESNTRVSPLKMEEMPIIGEARQRWSALRRKYDLYAYRQMEPREIDDSSSRSGALTGNSISGEEIESGMVQFAKVDDRILSLDFSLRNVQNEQIGSVNRNFGGFARELLTDTGVYALRMDSAAAEESQDGEPAGMTLDQRAVMLATAVSIDFDYFSNYSNPVNPGFVPGLWPMGGSAAGAGAGAGTVGAGAAEGAAAEGVATVAGGAVRGAATRGAGGMAADSGIAAAGTMAGYEAMQRGVYGNRGQDDASPQASRPEPGTWQGQEQEQMENRPGNDEVWGDGQDPWSQPPSSGAGGGGGGDGDGGGGGGWLSSISDFFSDD